MAIKEAKNASLSEVDPEFAPFIPGINERFEEIWKFKTAQELRDKFRGSRQSYPHSIPKEGFEITHRNVPVTDGSEVEVRIYKPEGVTGILPVFYMIHGGGWVVGNHDTEGAVNLSLCVKSKIAVISVNYRQAPEFPYPVPFNDSWDVLKWIVSNSAELQVDSSKILIGGNSAGGNIVAAVVQRSRNEGVKGIVGQVLNIPALCYPKHFPSEKYELLSFEQNKNSPTINRQRMTWFWDQYLLKEESDVYANPLLAASFENLPPTLVQVAGMDPLRDEGIAYAGALKAAGVPTTLKIHKGVPHGFSNIITLQATTNYYQNVVDWVNGLLLTL